MSHEPDHRGPSPAEGGAPAPEAAEVLCGPTGAAAVPEALAACTEPLLIGVRHHSPVLAAAVPALLDAADPDAVLVELPLEAGPWLEWLGHPDTVAPVALVLGDAGRGDHSYYPFADFSPELAAVRWARARGVPVHAVDLPASLAVVDDGGGAGPAEGPAPDRALLRAAGVEDGEELWDRLVEARSYGAAPERVRRAALALGWAHRAAALRSGGVGARDRARETWMRRRIGEIGAARPVAVVGAFHAAALLPPHALPAAVRPGEGAPGGAPDTAAAAFLRGPEPEGLPPTGGITVPAPGEQPGKGVSTALIPYTFALLDSRSGYPAGIRDPEWQQDVHAAGGDPEGIERAAVRRLSAIGGRLRADGHVCGVPDTTAAYRMARDLAALRGLPAPGRRELVEGLSGALAQGEPLGRARALARAAQHELVGSRRGAPAPGAPVSGLVADATSLLRRLGLPGPGEEGRDLRLDPLRGGRDRERHIALHRLYAAGVSYAEPRQGGPTADGETLGRLWTARWTPATSATLELASCYGPTLEQAARGRVAARLRDAGDGGEGSLTPEAAGDLLTQAAECALTDLASDLGDRVREEVLPRAGLSDAVELHDRVQRVVSGQVPGMPHAPEPLHRLRVRLAEAAVASVPGVSGSTDPADAAALLRVVRLVQDQAPLPGAVGSQRLLWHLGLLAESGGPLAQGAASAALMVLGDLAPGDMAVRLAGWVEAAAGGGPLALRLTGALTVAAPVVEADAGVLDALTARVEAWSDPGFLTRLPALREGFEALSAAARSRFLDAVTERIGEVDARLEVPPELALALAGADAAARAALEALVPGLLHGADAAPAGAGTAAPAPGRRAADGPAPGTPAPGVPSAPLPPGAGGTAGPSVPTGAVPPADGSGRPGTACAEAPPEALDAAGQPSPGPVPGGGAPHAIGAADRWRLVLGRPPRGGGTLARRASAALDELYGRGHGEGSQETSNRPGARGGDGSPEPAARRWDEELQDLFGGTVREEVLGRAAARGRADALDRLDPGRVTASVDLLEQVLSLAGALPEARLAKLRPLIAAITEQLVRQLARRMSPALSGLSVPRPTRRRGGPLDLGRTVRANLRTVRPGPDGPLLIPEAPVFRTRARRSADWHVHIVVDVSGSMERSTVYAALVAAVLHGLPALSVSFTTFSTEVVDLTDRVPDPLSLLLEVSVGGGTDIGAGLAHTRAKVRVPSRTIVALVTDFEEGGNLSRTLAEVRALAASGAHLLGLAALDDTGAPVCNQALAAQFVAAGMPVASLSPQELASWIGEKVRG
ncbi:DUF5682 family protein [Nocardiopsis tropica]|uniref:DUF5682 family protein n=2 Tax=Nocardiopsis tropica TaxID=109330 RepID=A0ABU7KKU0_9ACTN|nr:DUF5682 family protein [Nocardiopsis umidischolae]MEE2049891.1 DUF5682 family protein [Nocardiopsis umidischolae]